VHHVGIFSMVKEFTVVKYASKDEFHTLLWQWKNCCAVSWSL